MRQSGALSPLHFRSVLLVKAAYAENGFTLHEGSCIAQVLHWGSSNYEAAEYQAWCIRIMQFCFDCTWVTPKVLVEC